MNKPYKILFFLPSYRIGGITSSLYSLLYAIDPKIINAYVYAGSDTGEYKGRMPNCSEMRGNWFLSRSSEGLGTKDKVLHKIKMLLKNISKPLGLDIESLVFRIAEKKLKLHDFDAFVCFSEGMATYCSKIPAKKRIAWIHCDYSRHLSLSNKEEESAAYGKYDKIVCVSAFAKDVFDKIFPQHSHKTLSIHNIINIEDIQKKAKDESILSKQFDYSSFTIVSAGRLDPVKGFAQIPSMAKKLKDLTSNPFKWYIIGGGNDTVKQEIISGIVTNGMKNDVILLGQQPNIYPYLAHSNLYVCTSHSESFPMVICEAKALCVPVLSNAFPSVRESVIDGVDGYVVTIEEMPMKINEIMNSRMRVDKPRLDNDESLKRVYGLFNK